MGRSAIGLRVRGRRDVALPTGPARRTYHFGVPGASEKALDGVERVDFAEMAPRDIAGAVRNLSTAAGDSSGQGACASRSARGDSRASPCRGHPSRDPGEDAVVGD